MTEPKNPRGRKAAAPPPEPEAEAVQGSVEARTEMIVAEAQADPVALFTDGKRYSEFYERVKREVEGHEPDLTTAKGRAAIASLAFRVTKAKTSLDKAGLGLTAGWREQIATVNAARGKMTSELDELAKAVRKPLTDWEAAEAARQLQVEARLRGFQEASIVGEEETAASVRDRGRALYEEPLEPEIFGDRLEEAQAAKDAAVATLLRAVARLEREEADRAELARLRAEAEERQRKEAQTEAARGLAGTCVRIQSVDDPDAEEVAPEVIRERLEDADLPADLEGIVAEAAKPLWADHRRQLAERRAEAARLEEEARQAREREVREAEERAAARAREEEEARQREAREAEDARRREEELAREREREAEEAERRRVHEAELAEERRRANEAQEQAAAAERRAEDEKRAREAEEAQRVEAARVEAAEKTRREADQAHRQKVAGEARDDLVRLGVEKKLAEKVVLGLAAGEVRHASLHF